MRDSYEAGLFGYLRLICTYVRVILIRQNCLVTLSTHDLYRVGLFVDFRLIRTYVRTIHMRQDCLVTLG